jgi:hypothetical protein
VLESERTGGAGRGEGLTPVISAFWEAGGARDAWGQVPRAEWARPCLYKNKSKKAYLGMVVHACKSQLQEGEAGGSLEPRSLVTVSYDCTTVLQPGPTWARLPPKTKKRRKRNNNNNNNNDKGWVYPINLYRTYVSSICKIGKAFCLTQSGIWRELIVGTGSFSFGHVDNFECHWKK